MDGAAGVDSGRYFLRTARRFSGCQLKDLGGL